MSKSKILQAAFDEGKKHIGKEEDVIYFLAEKYVQAQPYTNLKQDDAMFGKFVEGSKTVADTDSCSNVKQIKI